MDNQVKDSIIQKLKEYSLNDWPDRSQLPIELLPYYPIRYEISFAENLVLKNNRIVIPENLKSSCSNFIHTGHLAIVKCRDRAKSSVWWLGLSSQIENLVRNCPLCVENRTNRKETFLKDEITTRPWLKIALDLFKLEKWYKNGMVW
ncbi:Integrase zinc binding domain [Popillia japonica]|uniref:RNA-directed DNA polymerase n=1 Tax=Popillia japonica TaxID=7064 RepID=A0AAW1KL72_POPJA